MKCACGTCEYCRGLAILDRLTQHATHTVTIDGTEVSFESAPGDSATMVADGLRAAVLATGLDVSVSIVSPTPTEPNRCEVIVGSTQTVELKRIQIDVVP